MKHRRTWILALLLPLLVALALRLPHLHLRPMHGDEAIHTVKFDTLWRTGTYAYDPTDYHGPTIYYFTYPVMALSGTRDYAHTSEWTFRIVPVLFGVGLILLLPLLGRGLGRAETWVAALLTAISPAMVFYSRYYIQEMLLVFFTLLTITAGYRFTRTGRKGWALAMGAGVGLMWSTKETWVLSIAAMVAAAVAAAGWTRWRDRRTFQVPSQPLPWIAAALLACGIAILFYSAFFTHWAGVVDMLRAATGYLHRAGGGKVDQIHPWGYYLGMLAYSHLAPGPWWSEGLILALALVGALVALAGKGSEGGDAGLLRFLTFYTLFLTLIYSTIRYKTPWCLLSFLDGMILLAGVGAVWLVRSAPGKALKAMVSLVLLAAAAQLGWQAFLLNFQYYVDQRNPYVYAQAVHDVVRLGDRMEALAKVSPQGHKMLIQVIAADPWPLPWYLRRFTQVGYWTQPPPALPAPVIVASPDFDPALLKLNKKLHDDYQMDYFGLRPEEVLLVYTRNDLWQSFIRKQLAKGKH